MSPRLTEQYAERIADKLILANAFGDEKAVGFIDPFTIIMVLCSILSLLVTCWSAVNKEVSQAELHAALVQECEDPKRKAKLIKRAARQFRRKSDEPLSKEQSMILAAASIEEALITPPAEFQNYAVSCGTATQEDLEAFAEEDEEE